LVRRFYEHFMRKIVERVKQFSKDNILPSGLESIFGHGNVVKRKSLIAKSTARLEGLVSGEIKDELADYSKTLVYGEEDSSEDEVGAGIGAKLSDGKPKVVRASMKP